MDKEDKNLNTEAVAVFIKKVADAIGVIYEPTRIEKKAKAEAKANEIKALSDAKTDKIKALSIQNISEIQNRELKSLVYEHGKKLKNMERIIAYAASQIKDDAKPEKLDEDWISHFFEKCRIVSDREMQSLWSRILAGEANKPGSISKRTIELVSTLDNSDANLFTQFCTFTILFDERRIPIVFNSETTIYREKGIDFESLNHLESIGFIKLDYSRSFCLYKLPQNFIFFYFGISISFKLRPDCNITLKTGKALLTQIGQELAPICGAQINYEFLNFFTDYYRGSGIEVEYTLPNDAN